jgi:hypothetical protein
MTFISILMLIVISIIAQSIFAVKQTEINAFTQGVLGKVGL